MSELAERIANVHFTSMEGRAKDGKNIHNGNGKGGDTATLRQ